MPHLANNDYVAVLLEQLALSTKSQAPLDEVLLALSETIENDKSRALLASAAAEMQKEGSASDPTETLSKVLPARLRPLLHLGARYGSLPQVLHALAQHETSRRNVRQRVRRVIAYPALVLGLLAILVVFLSLYVVPQFDELFVEFGLELPPATETVLECSRGAPLLIGYLAVFFFGVKLASSWKPTAPLMHWLRTAIPLVGRAWVWSSHEQFTSQMAALTNLNIPVDEALEVTARSLEDRHLALTTARLAEKCRDGSTLSESMRKSMHFEGSLSAMVTAAEPYNALPVALREASLEYRKQLERYGAFLARIVPPVLTVFVGAMLLGLCGVLFVPLVSLIENLS